MLTVAGIAGGLFAGVMLVAWAEQDGRLTWLKQMRLEFFGNHKLIDYLWGGRR